MNRYLKQALLSVSGFILFAGILYGGIITKPYSLISANIKNGGIGTVDIADGVITDTKLAYGVSNLGDIKRYGATGDGVTNDRDAIQAAIDAVAAAGGGVVSLQSGKKYYVEMPAGQEATTLDTPACALHIPTSTRPIIFDGNGSEMVTSDTCLTDSPQWGTEKYYALLGVDNDADSVIIQNLKLRHTGIWHTLSGVGGSDIAAQTVGIYVIGDYCTIQNVEIVKFYDGIFGDYNGGGKNLTLLNVNSHGNGYSGAKLWGTSARIIGGRFNYNGRLVEQNTRVSGETSANYSNGYGIALNSDNSSITNSEASYNWLKGIDSHYSTNLTISNNSARYNGYSNYPIFSAHECDIYSSANNSIITNNTLGGHYGPGIYKDGIMIYTESSRGNVYKQVIISNNNISGVGSGIYLAADMLDSISITGNKIRNCSRGLWSLPVGGIATWGIRTLMFSNNSLINCQNAAAGTQPVDLTYVGTAMIYNNSITVDGSLGDASTEWPFHILKVSALLIGGNFCPGRDQLFDNPRESANGVPTVGTFRKGNVIYRIPSNLANTAGDTMAVVCITEGTITDTTFTTAAGLVIHSVAGSVGDNFVILDAALPVAKFVTGKIITIGAHNYEIVWRDVTSRTTKLIINPAIIAGDNGTHTITWAVPTFRKWGVIKEGYGSK